MNTVEIAIDKCNTGAILAESVLNEHDAPLVVRNTVLNDYIINRLVELGVEKIHIHAEDTNNSSTNVRHQGEKIKKSYSKSILGIKSVLNELAAGRALDIAKINSISDNIYSTINDSMIIVKMLNETKNFDNYTYTHSLNVAFYSMLIGKWLNLSSNNIKNLIYTGLLHDIGKTKVPIEILNKDSKLSAEEFAVVKKHTIYGYELVKSTEYFTDEICDAVLTHHEREDKSGYPIGIGDKYINIYAKIVAVADVYDAMTSDRIYKKRATPFDAFEMFQTMGVKNFDAKIVKTFLSNISAYYVGSKVMLNTGEIGEIVYIPFHSITEPVISIGSEYLDLARTKDKLIAYML